MGDGPMVRLDTWSNNTQPILIISQVNPYDSEVRYRQKYPASISDSICNIFTFDCLSSNEIIYDKHV